MTADESGQLSGSQPATDSGLSGSMSPDGDSRQQTDIDDRPVGACYNELQAVKAAVDAARAADARVKDALAKFWQCRDAAAAEAHAARQELSTTPLTRAQAESLASVFKSHEEHLIWIERHLLRIP